MTRLETYCLGTGKRFPLGALGAAGNLSQSLVFSRLPVGPTVVLPTYDLSSYELPRNSLKKVTNSLDLETAPEKSSTTVCSASSFSTYPNPKMSTETHCSKDRSIHSREVKALGNFRRGP